MKIKTLRFKSGLKIYFWDNRIFINVNNLALSILKKAFIQLEKILE